MRGGEREGQRERERERERRERERDHALHAPKIRSNIACTQTRRHRLIG